MGLDNMRGGYGRCPPFLAGGLIVMCVILMFNWWSLSSQNYDLIKQLEDLSEQLKMSSHEQESCIKQRQNLEVRYFNVDQEAAKLRVQFEQARTENEEVKKTIETKEEELKTANKNKEEIQGTADRCATELDSLKKLDESKDKVIASLRLDTERLSTDLQEQKRTVKQFHNEIAQMQAELATAKTLKGHKVPTSKASVSVMLPGDLPVIKNPSAVMVSDAGLKGMVFHPGQKILPRDPPNAFRPPPRLSVTQLKPRTESSVTLPHNNIAVGGNHESQKELEAEENNNAKEEHDDADVQAEANADANQVPEPEPRMEVGEDDTAPV